MLISENRVFSIVDIPRTTTTSMQLPHHVSRQLEQAGQRHVLRFWDELDEAEQDSFAAQLATVDWHGLPELQHLVAARRSGGVPATGLPDLDTARTPPCLLIGSAQNSIARADAVRRGEESLRAGSIGAILVAGGQGSRLGCNGPKGLYQVGPVSRASLFELLLGKLVAVRQRFGRGVPLAIMTSSATDAGTKEFLAAHRHCGLDPAQVLVFQQQDLPALDDTTGNLLLEAPGRLAMAPDGHGGMLVALAKCGGLDWFGRHGVEQIATFQVDNPLAMPLNSEFLGYHLLSGAEFSTQVVRKREPAERVGVVVEADGVHYVVEYSDLPAALAAERLPDGALKFHAGSIAVHAFQKSFLDRVAAGSGALPLHLAHKAVPFLDDAGTRVVPKTPNAIKFERFIFDLMPVANRVCVVEIDPADGFAPLKNPPGATADAPEHVHAALVDHARRLLRRAGISVADGIDVELSAKGILDEDDIRRSLPAGTTIREPLVVGG